MPIALASVPVPGAAIGTANPAAFLKANPGTILLLKDAGGGDGVDVQFTVQSGAVALRPYAWFASSNLVAFPDGGRWVGLGFDSVSGASAATANPASGNASAWGRFQDCDAGGRAWMLVAESGSVANVLEAQIDIVRRSLVTVG